MLKHQLIVVTDATYTDEKTPPATMARKKM
jgi:hypothetical protein